MKIYPTYSRELIQQSSLPLRSRANTSDSSSAGSSDGGLDRLNFDGLGGAGAQPPRRRSHRPRGCRGGRKNRRSQQAKAVALLPKEIIDPMPLSPRANHGSNARNNRQTVGCMTVLSNKKTIQHHGLTEVRNPVESVWKPIGETRKIWSQPTAPGGLPFMSEHNHTSAGSMAFYAAQNRANPTTTDNLKVAGSVRCNPNQGRNTETHFRPLQVNLSEESSTGSTGSEQKSKQNPRNGNTLLPPLPAQPRESSPTVFEGPNPYALSTNPHQYHPQQPQHQKRHQFQPPHQQQHQPHFVQNSILNNISFDINGNIIDSHSSNSDGRTNNNTNNTDCSDDYRSRRIEKQRQTLGNGGSLFVTSPRSFLMGVGSNRLSSAW